MSLATTSGAQIQTCHWQRVLDTQKSVLIGNHTHFTLIHSGKLQWWNMQLALHFFEKYLKGLRFCRFYLKCLSYNQTSHLTSHVNKQTATRAHPHARTHTTHWPDRCIVLHESCVWWVASRGMGQCAAARFLSVSVYSHVLSSTDSSSLLLLHCMRESLSILRIREAVISLIHLNLKRGGFFTSSFTCRAASVSLHWRGKGASLSPDKVRQHFVNIF